MMNDSEFGFTASVGDVALDALHEGVRACRACPLWRNATHAVCGDGSSHAQVMLVGDEPGLIEDLGGHALMGLAAQLLYRTLAEVGVDRQDVYLTNTVKHIKTEQRGVSRIVKKPNKREIQICSAHWLRAEIELIRPTVIVCLGKTAASILISEDFNVKAGRGQFLASDLAEVVYATWHPADVLNCPQRQRSVFVEQFLSDLQLIKQALVAGPKSRPVRHTWFAQRDGMQR